MKNYNTFYDDPYEKDYRESMVEEIAYNDTYGAFAFCYEFAEREAYMMEAETFLYAQYKRFGVEIPPEARVIVRSVLDRVLETINFKDPYLLYCGVGDIDITEDWCNKTFMVKDIYYRDSTPVEAEPEHLETYRLNPRQGEERLQEMLSKPGLDALDFVDADYLRGTLFDLDWGYPVTHYIDKESLRVLEEERGWDNKHFQGFMELAAWASYIWVVSPLSEGFKRACSEFFDLLYEHGECIVYSHTFLGPDKYDVIDRVPNSCAKCGAVEYCIEHYYEDEAVYNMCSACASAGMPKANPAFCGARLCKRVQCQHNYYNPMGAAAMGAYYRSHGQLAQMGRGSNPASLGQGHQPHLLV